VVFTGAEVQSPVAYPWSGRQAKSTHKKCGIHRGRSAKPRSLSVVGKAGEKHAQKKKKAKIFLFSFILLKPIIRLLLLIFYIYRIL
jgi:hypothetical protein